MSIKFRTALLYTLAELNAISLRENDDSLDGLFSNDSLGYQGSLLRSSTHLIKRNCSKLNEINHSWVERIASV